MAGNSKKKRKPVPKGIGTLQRKIELSEKGLIERRQRKAKVMDRNHRLTQLPMGHPANSYVLDMTFKPMHQLFDDHERTGTHLFGDDGIAVLWVERDQVYTPVVEACVQLHEQFDFTGKRFEWGDVPPGLLAYGMKLAMGQKFVQQDIDDARATIAWMREKLSGITCYDWYDSMMDLEKIEAAKAQESVTG